MTHSPLSPARDEENRRLATWIEPRPIIRATQHGAKSPLGFWHGYNNGREFVWELAVPPDFYTEESANAQLLDKLLSSGLRVCMEPGDPPHENEIVLLCPYYLGGGGTMFRHDRKTATVKAAPYYLEAQK